MFIYEKNTGVAIPIGMYIIKFEKENNVKIEDTYFINAGWEGESIWYLSLNGLTESQKEDFIVQRNPGYSEESLDLVLKQFKKPIALKEAIKPRTVEALKKHN